LGFNFDELVFERALKIVHEHVASAACLCARGHHAWTPCAMSLVAPRAPRCPTGLAGPTLAGPIGLLAGHWPLHHGSIAVSLPLQPLPSPALAWSPVASLLCPAVTPLRCAAAALNHACVGLVRPLRCRRVRPIALCCVHLVRSRPRHMAVLRPLLRAPSSPW
jgi:hypothetical protein